MITESGPPPWPSEDDTPTQTFGVILPDDPPPAATSATPREEHGLTALLERDNDNVLPPRVRERRTAKLTAALAAVVLIVLAVATYEVVSGVGDGTKTAAHTGGVSHPAQQASARATAVSSSASASSPPPSSAAAGSAPAAAPVVARTLHPVSATAVGPGGRAGDDPQNARSVLGGGSRTPWTTDWYNTAEFGGLQTGTGLLLDLGSARTVGAVTVTLALPGVNFQLRAGQSADLASLGVVSTQQGVGGTVQLSFAHPVHARYLLIWFTRLAPDGAGTYQAKVGSVTVRGS
ncbi:MAG TPA: hypothetical protein VKU39_02780 [Streptosporangiaceae bacterium]|nr:hypothetical protein [Streptosporangiaceae bacterium]